MEYLNYQNALWIKIYFEKLLKKGNRRRDSLSFIKRRYEQGVELTGVLLKGIERKVNDEGHNFYKKYLAKEDMECLRRILTTLKKGHEMFLQNEQER